MCLDPILCFSSMEFSPFCLFALFSLEIEVESQKDWQVFQGNLASVIPPTPSCLPVCGESALVDHVETCWRRHWTAFPPQTEWVSAFASLEVCFCSSPAALL